MSQALQASTLSTRQIGAEITLTYGPGQTMSVFLNGAEFAKGCWWVEGDTYCQDLGPENGGPQCGYVVQNGRKIMWFDMEGYLSDTFEYQQP